MKSKSIIGIMAILAILMGIAIISIESKYGGRIKHTNHKSNQFNLPDEYTLTHTNLYIISYKFTHLHPHRNIYCNPNANVKPYLYSK